MLSAIDNEIITTTDSGTPMGELFRRFWQPVALSSELPAPDCAPIRVQVMGEHFVMFRDTRGKVGLVDRNCPHRGADLFYGRNEDCGLRCVYHGWKFDVTGRAVDMPNVPPNSAYHGKMSVRAYPTRESGDIIWAFFGPRDRIPEIPELEFGVVPPEQRYVTKKLQDCNWAQSIEGALDTSHFSFLHMPAPHAEMDPDPQTNDLKRLRWIREDPLPRFSILEHEVGFVVGGARRADGNDLYWRMAHYMLPAHATTPSTLPGENHFGYTFVPINDVSCWIYTYAWNPDRGIAEDEREQFSRGFGIIAKTDGNFVPLRNRANNYLIDREKQRRISYTGVDGLADQDAMIQENQGQIADRTREHLSPSDAGIVRFRRTVIAAAKAVQEGSGPEAPWLHKHYRLRSGSWVAADGMPFEEVMKARFGHRIGLVE